ncbi:biopolymer transporter ExbD [candidate division KSB1 bacterium]|nr:biopolymer transporter ExbD [candidate division KSB1 bacterium]
MCMKCKKALVICWICYWKRRQAMAIVTTRKPMIAFSTIGLTDIVLLLLIFFLLTSSFVVQPGIKIKLPKAATGETDESDKIFLTITENERLFLNQRQISRSDLAIELKNLLQQDSNRVVVIRADQNLSLSATIRVVDTAKLAGAERFIIATEPGL